MGLDEYLAQETRGARFEAVTLGLQTPFEIGDSGVRALCQWMLGALLNPDEALCWRVNSSTGGGRQQNRLGPIPGRA